MQNDLADRARKLRLYGILAHLEKYACQPWLEELLVHEEEARQQRSLERRLREARLGKFKPIADFDWHWPRSIDREQIDDLFSLEFILQANNPHRPWRRDLPDGVWQLLPLPATQLPARGQAGSAGEIVRELLKRNIASK